MTTIKVPEVPPLEVVLDPDEIWDAKGHRALVKEFRAAGWEGGRVIWAAANRADGKCADQPLVAFKLEAAAPVLDLLYRARSCIPQVGCRIPTSGDDRVAVRTEPGANYPRGVTPQDHPLRPGGRRPRTRRRLSSTGSEPKARAPEGTIARPARTRR